MLLLMWIFYMGKDYLILPKFNVEEDKEAYEILNKFYEGKKKIYQIVSRKILLGGGNLHCVTMQIPVGGKMKSFILFIKN